MESIGVTYPFFFCCEANENPQLGHQRRYDRLKHLIVIGLFLSSLLLLSIILMKTYFSKFMKIFYGSKSNISIKLSRYFCDIFENQLIRKHIKCSEVVQSDWTRMNIEHMDGMSTTTIHLHSIIAKDTSATFETVASNVCGKPKLLWVHGVGSSATLSLGLSGVLDRLISSYDIYAIDIPGFGRSTASESLRFNSVDEVDDVMADVFAKYIETKQLGKVYLAAHSYGGYHALNFAFRRPDLVEKLLLVDPAGLFPTFGKEGALYAFMFKFGLPMSVLRFLGNFGFSLYLLLSVFRSDPEQLAYWYQIQAAPDAMSDYLVSKLITLNLFSAYWKKSAFCRFAGLTVPIALAFGETDSIVPPHQGVALSGLVGGGVPIYIIADAWHMPMRMREGLDFATLCKHAFDAADLPSPASSAALNSLSVPTDRVSASFEAQYLSVPSFKHTYKSINALYGDLFSHIRRIVGTTKLKYPSVKIIRGDSISDIRALSIVDDNLKHTFMKHFTE